MRNVQRILFAGTLLLAAVATFSCGRDRSFDRVLDGLDSYISRREEFDSRKSARLETIRNLAWSAEDPQTRFDVSLQAADAFSSYRYDSARFYLNRCLELSSALGDRERYQAAMVRLGHLDAKAGHFVEAYSSLFTRVDTAGLNPAHKADYYYVVYDFCKDLEGNSVSPENLPMPDRLAYRELIYKMFPETSASWRIARIDELLEEDRLDEAESLCQALVGSVAPEERPYALYAYLLSDISGRKGNLTGQLEWLVRSAECDLVNAVKDYASLTIIAEIMTGRDVNRAFHYMRIAQEDAVFYNGMLRPWQISQSFNIIQEAYESTRRDAGRLSVITAILLAALLATLGIAFAGLSKRSRTLAKAQGDLQESNALLAQKNEELKGLNREISEAGHIKEAYIGRILDLMSANVSKMQAYDNHVRNALKQGKSEQLLKELSISTRTDDELDAFYRTFDSTFLALYPTFIQDFNALLREDARVYPKKDELLCTELRIFALIRLGIEDSVRIASLLHYSVSTIYNYKVKVKNGALGDRETFEECVKSIGL